MTVRRRCWACWLALQLAEMAALFGLVWATGQENADLRVGLLAFGFYFVGSIGSSLSGAINRRGAA